MSNRTTGIAVYTSTTSESLSTCSRCSSRVHRHRAADACDQGGHLVCDRCARAAAPELFKKVHAIREFYNLMQTLREQTTAILTEIPAHWFKLPRAAKRRRPSGITLYRVEFVENGPQ